MFYLLGCNTMYSGESQLTFWRNVSLVACFVLLSSLALKMEVSCSSEMSVDFN
jgi:hypothetical protein